MLHLYVPANNADLIVYLIMLIVALLLAYAAGYYTHISEIGSLIGLENKLQHDLDRLHSQPATPKTEAPQVAAPISKPRTMAPQRPQDDLTRIHGINEDIEHILSQIGIHSYRQLQLFNPLSLKHEISRRDVELQIADIIVWQQQAALAAANKWDDLASLQEELDRSNKQ